MTVLESYPTIRVGGLFSRILSKNWYYVFKNKNLCLKILFSHLAFACVRESVRTRDVGMGVSHSHP